MRAHRVPASALVIPFPLCRGAHFPGNAPHRSRATAPRERRARDASAASWKKISQATPLRERTAR
ncbi:hypothetical protein AB0M41_17395 [Streptomyces sp. NPDC051896]|uniref:hypothetical protein n=1 Tax=Streptomyces sp. NPDC051896 TaxID=3155416 RepID=UPI0034384657